MSNPFEASQSAFSNWSLVRWARRPASVVLLACLLVGLIVVVWRARSRTADAWAGARIEAQAVSSALELQFSQAISAVEVLGALARQSGGPIPSFQTVAGELLAKRPGIAALQLLPGGVVTDVVPRARNERAIGFNILQDPFHRFGVNEAIAKRGLTVAGPLRLYSGEPGITVLTPVFQRHQDGREGFWGFVAASVRLSDVLARANVNDLPGKGYYYMFLAPGPGQQTNVSIVQYGRVLPGKSVQQPIRAHNLELRLALQPRGGWVNQFQMALEGVGVIIAAGLLSLLTGLGMQRRELMAASSTMARQLAAETGDRTQAQEQLRSIADRALMTEADLKQLQTQLADAESSLAESKAQWADLEHRSGQAIATAEAKRNQVELRAEELQAHLDMTRRLAAEAAQAAQAKIDRLQAAFERAGQTVAQLETSLEKSTRAEKEAIASAQVRMEQDRAAMADQQAQLDEARRAAREACERAAQTAQAGGLAKVAPDRGPVAAGASMPELLEPAGAAEPATALPEVESVPAGAIQADPDEPSAVAESQTQVTARPAHPSAAREHDPSETSRASAPGNQLHLFSEPSAPADKSLPGVEPEPKEPRPAQAARASLSVDVSELRTAVHQIVPLLTDGDPGAKDCLKAHRNTFRSALTPQASAEFEQSIKAGDFSPALELLKKAARKHGVGV